MGHLILQPCRQQQKEERFLVGLTGGIGTGKSTLLNLFQKLGAHTISADNLAREVVEPGTQGLTQIVHSYGKRILTSDGTLDRAALAKIVFGDEQQRLKLEEITHPLIADILQERLETMKGIVVYEMPLLVEKNLSQQFDCVVIIDSPLHQRLARLQERGLSQTEAEERISVQATDDQRRAVANIWVNNQGTKGDLYKTASEIYTHWMKQVAE